MQNNVSIPSLKSNKDVVFTKNDGTVSSTGLNPINNENINPEVVTSAVNQAPLGSEVLSVNEIPKSVLIPTVAGTWLASNYLVDKLNTNFAKDNYSDTAFGKIGAKIDKFSENNWFGKKIQSGIDGVGNLYNKAASKSKILRSLRDFSGRPEWGFAKFPFYGLKGFLGMDLEGNVLKDLMSDIAYDPDSWFNKYTLNYQKLEQYGLDNKKIDDFVKSLAGKSKEEKAVSLLKKELELLNVDATELSKAGNDVTKLSELAKECKFKNLLGLTQPEYERVVKLLQDEPKEAIKLLKNAIAKSPKLKLSHWRVYSFMGSRKLGKLVSDVFGRKTTWQEYLNKYKVAVGEGAKSSLGKFATKSLGWITEAHTGRFAFGKLFALFAAAEVAKAIIHTFKADGIKEKISTATENFTNLLTTAVGSTLAMIGMHKVGGFKYLGMNSKSDIDNYRKAVEKFNKEVKSGKYNGDKAAYKTAKKAVTDLLNKKDLNFFQKTMQKLGSFIEIGNERLASYRGTSSLMNGLRKICNGNIIGVPLRIWLGAFALTGLVTKFAMGLDHKIFGKPKFSVEDEEKGEEEITPKNEAESMIDGKQPKTEVPPVNTQTQNTQKSDTNLLDMYRKNPQNNPQNNSSTSTTTNNMINNTTINNSDNNGTKYVEPIRTYIPSPESTITDSEDTTAGDKALLAADMAEKTAKMYLQSM